MYYKVFVVNFETRMRRAQFHRSLFIAVEETPIRRGPVYEVRGPRQPRDSSNQCEFYLSFNINKAPENSMQYLSMTHAGRINAANVHKVLDLCEAITPPIVPPYYQGESPNSCDWLDNVLHRLHRREIVEFVEGFQVPTAEVSLISKAFQPDPSPSKSTSAKRLVSP